MKELQKQPTNWKRIRRNMLAYVFGIGLGAFLVWALWLRNRDVPSFWPEGMVKDKLMKSTIEENDINMCYLTCLQTNDSVLRASFKKADVQFPPVKREPFPVYRIATSTSSGEKMRLYIESKDSTYNILKLEDLPGTTKNHICDCKVAGF